jgi:tetratricopeptide (TPR) repeat protein
MSIAWHGVVASITRRACAGAAQIERLHEAGERNGLATAVMEHANAMVNLASALFVTKRHEQAKMCYERALEVGGA